jgi:hypothetical protein
MSSQAMCAAAAPGAPSRPSSSNMHNSLSHTKLSEQIQHMHHLALGPVRQRPSPVSALTRALALAKESHVLAQ